MRRVAPTALLLGLLLALATPATAHGPPPIRDQDTRLLADHNDDCGDDGGSISNCNGSHDLVALDIREGHDAKLGDIVYFRFALNHGTGSLRDVLTVKVNGATKTFEIRTTDNQKFETTGFDSVTVGPLLSASGTQDGSRFVVEAGVKLQTLGGVGAKLTDYLVEAYTGTTRGDYMPGGYYNALGVKVTDPDQGSDETDRIRTAGYDLRGPGYYAVATLPTQATVAEASQLEMTVTLRNLLPNTPQTLDVALSGADGVQARFTVGPDDGHLTLDLPKGGQTTRTLVLTGGEAGASGTLTVTVTTSLGGRSTHTLPYTVTDPASDTSSPTSGGPGAGSTPAKGAPTLGLPVALALLAFAGLRRRS